MVGPHSVEWKQYHQQLWDIEDQLFKRTGGCATVEQILDKLNAHGEFVEEYFPEYVQTLSNILPDANLVTVANGMSKMVFKGDDWNTVYKVYKTEQAFSREHNAYQFIKQTYPHKTILAKTSWHQGWCAQEWTSAVDQVPDDLVVYITDPIPTNYGVTQSGETVIIDWENLAFDHVGMFWRDFMETKAVIDTP